MHWSRRGSEQVKMRSHCLVTKCDKQRDQGHRMCVGIGGEESFMYFLSGIARYLHSRRFLCMNALLQNVLLT